MSISKSHIVTGILMMFACLSIQAGELSNKCYESLFNSGHKYCFKNGTDAICTSDGVVTSISSIRNSYEQCRLEFKDNGTKVSPRWYFRGLIEQFKDIHASKCYPNQKQKLWSSRWSKLNAFNTTPERSPKECFDMVNIDKKCECLRDFSAPAVNERIANLAQAEHTFIFVNSILQYKGEKQKLEQDKSSSVINDARKSLNLPKCEIDEESLKKCDHFTMFYKNYKKVVIDKDQKNVQLFNKTFFAQDTMDWNSFVDNLRKNDQWYLPDSNLKEVKPWLTANSELCHDIIKMKKELCSGKNKGPIKLKNIINKSAWGNLSSNERLAIEQKNCEPESRSNNIWQDRSHTKVVHRLRKVMSGLGNSASSFDFNDSAPIDSEPQGIMNDIKDAFDNYPIDEVAPEVNEESENSLDKVEYHKNLVEDAPEKVENDLKNHISDKQKQVQNQIDNLNKSLAKKEKELPTKKEGSTEQSKLSAEIKDILDELKKAKEENRILKEKMAKPQEVSKHSAASQSVVKNSNMNRDSMRGNAKSIVVDDDKASMRSRAAGESSNKQVVSRTVQKNITGVGDRSNSSSINHSLLSFSYSDFVKMNKESLFKDNKGKLIEIIKKDENGNDVIYVFKPILDNKGNYAAFVLVKKEDLVDKKTVVVKPVEKEVIPVNPEDRAWYKKLIDVFKEKTKDMF